MIILIRMVISYKQNLTEDFIRQFKDDINLIKIMKYQDLCNKLYDELENYYNDYYEEIKKKIKEFRKYMILYLIIINYLISLYPHDNPKLIVHVKVQNVANNKEKYLF